MLYFSAIASFMHKRLFDWFGQGLPRSQHPETGTFYKGTGKGFHMPSPHPTESTRARFGSRPNFKSRLRKNGPSADRTGEGPEVVTPHEEALPGVESAGRGVGANLTVNQLFDQEKFHARQGHGFAAEQANDLHDRLRGKDARILGDDFAKNGPDRIVDGQWIQSKYYADGRDAINSCFGDSGKGVFRYVDKRGEPMVIEVPKDDAIYDQAVGAMREKIANGQIEGVSDPAQAEELVRRGNCTYRQARNIAKAGNVDSLKFDAANGAVTAASAFGVSAVIAFGTCIWNGDKPGVAAKKAALCGLKVGGTSFIVSVVSSQLLKAGLNSAMVSSTEAIAAALGPKACAVIVNAFRTGGNIYGAAAMKSAAKLLRGNAVVAGLTVVVLSSLDIADIVRGRISPGQLAKNLAGTVSSVAGGTAGWVGGAALGSMVFPGVGTVVGGLLGSLGGGTAAGAAVNALNGLFIKDDAELMCSIVEEQIKKAATDHLMNEAEVTELVESVNSRLSGGTLKAMFAADDRETFVAHLMEEDIEKIVSERPPIVGSIDDQIADGLVKLLEESVEEAGNGECEGPAPEGR